MSSLLASSCRTRKASCAVVVLFNRFRHWLFISIVLLLLFIALSISTACERHTTLKVGGNNPPDFVMTGNGILTSIRLRGPNKQREALGEDASLYWVIELKEYDGSQIVEKISPVIYGKMPRGYVQIYPEKGEAPPLIEGERYRVEAVTSGANGASKYFSIKNGKALEESNQ